MLGALGSKSRAKAVRRNASGHCKDAQEKKEETTAQWVATGARTDNDNSRESRTRAGGGQEGERSCGAGVFHRVVWFSRLPARGVCGLSSPPPVAAPRRRSPVGESS